MIRDELPKQIIKAALQEDFAFVLISDEKSNKFKEELKKEITSQMERPVTAGSVLYDGAKITGNHTLYIQVDNNQIKLMDVISQRGIRTVCIARDDHYEDFRLTKNRAV